MISKTVEIGTLVIAGQAHFKVVNKWEFLGIPLFTHEQYGGHLGWSPPHTDPGPPNVVAMPTAAGMQ